MFAFGQVAFAEPPSVEIASPRSGSPLFGNTLIQARVHSSEALETVEVWLNGARAGTLPPPDFRLEVDVGEDNRERLIEVVARTVVGSEGRARRTYLPVRIDGKIELQLQQVFVTVTKNDGERVLGLKKGDFLLRDNRQKQSIVTLESGEIPFSAVLLLDASVSMKGRQMKAVEQGAQTFVEGLADLDEARMMVFAERLIASTGFTMEADDLVQVIPSREVEGGTALYDHLLWATHLLKERLSRRVMLLLSDGHDVHSLVSMDQVAEAIQRTEAQVYWIQISEPGVAEETRNFFHSFLPPKEIMRQRRLLRRTVERTGGRILRVSQPQEIVGALAEVLQELRDQYAIGYYPEPGIDDGRWHELQVEALLPGLQAKTRKGYYAPSPAPPQAP
ncbi:MAG: VWA domain-containing protein [Deltaproteobacteria bacterium]|nr:VWA domain-containing protein [Deltaproteobacteria bacterium]